MEHRTHHQVARVAGLHDSLRLAELMSEPMSRNERLHRWMKLLEAEPRRRLRTLYETEHQCAAVREGMRGEETAISVAFADPVLRAQGLRGDTYGNAKDFFGLSDPQLHHVVCGCHTGRTMRAGIAARRLEGFLPFSMRPGILHRIARALTGWR